MKTIVKSGLFALLALLVTGCATMTKEDVELVNRAKAIHRYPVSRAEFVRKMGLEEFASERIGGYVRSNRAWYLETWTLPNGKLVNAWDSEYAGDWKITETSIDALLNKKVVGVPTESDSARKAGDWIQVDSPDPPRKSFESCVITSRRGKQIFNSADYLRSLEKSP